MYTVGVWDGWVFIYIYIYMSGVEMMESELKLSLYSMYYNKCVWFICKFVYIHSLCYYEMGGMNGVVE